MKSKTLLTASLSVATVLVLGGCSTESAATENPPRPGTARTARKQAPVNTTILPEGTVLVVRTTTALSTKTMEAGQTFTANLEQPLVHDDREIASRGARVEGRLVDADDGGRVKGVASLSVQLTGLEVGGQLVGISTSTVTQNARTTKRKDAAEIGIGAGVGAAIGALAGGGQGAAIGAAAGGGAGTGLVLATHGAPAVIPSETVLHFALRAPVSIAKR